MESKFKIVDYDIYCPKCKYKDLDSAEDPCDECLGQPWNTDSRKPVNFEEEEK